MLSLEQSYGRAGLTEWQAAILVVWIDFNALSKLSLRKLGKLQRLASRPGGFRFQFECASPALEGADFNPSFWYSPSMNTARKRTATSVPASVCDSALHPFGGCERLRQQYATVGTGLLCLERSGSLVLVQRNLLAERTFREHVTFVPVEVLESFFDDLLDPEVPDERLSIAVRSWGHRVTSNLVAIIGVLGAVLAGLYVSALGMSLALSFLLAVSLAIPFATMLYLSTGGATRRLRFAQVLSREIARRRGTSDKTGMLTNASFSLREFLVPHGSQPVARRAIDVLH